MKTIFQYFVSTLIIIVALNPGLYAQQPFGAFKEPVRKAIDHSKTLQNANLENEKILLDKEMVQGKLLPNVSVNAGYGYVHSRAALDIPTQQLPLTGMNLFDGVQKSNLSSQMAMAGVTATQVIFSGLQISYGQKALAHKIEAQSLMTEAGYDGIAQEVICAFDQLMLLKEVDLLIADSEKRLNKEHQKVAKAIDNGLAIPYDRDKIKLAMLELESKKAEVQSNRDLLYFKLEELTGLSWAELEQISYPLLEIVLDENDALAMDRKELQALGASQKAYEYALKKEKGARLPMVFAFGNVSYFNAFGTDMTVKDLPLIGDLRMESNSLRLAPNYAVGIGMKWNIFEGKSHKSAIEKAKIDLKINKNKMADTQEKLALLQLKNKSDYTLSLKKIGINHQQVVIAKNNVQMASRLFEEGLQDVTERLEAENELYKQSLAYYNQIMNQRNAATELLKTNGNLYQTIIR